MEDMDLDFLGDPAKDLKRQPRFAPKGSRFQPKPKTEPDQSLPPSKTDCVDDPLPVPKKEDVGVKPDLKPENTNNAIDMDVHVKPDVKEEVGGDLMEIESREVEVEVEAEDEVIREIDVYFTPSIDPNTRLYVFQYPLRPLWRPYELEEKCEEVRVKAESAEVEIDLAIDVDSKNYDTGPNAKVQITKQTLSLSWKAPRTSACAIGVLSGNKLHLNPIHALAQLRPSMHHLDLDSKESKKKTAAHSNIDGAVKLEENQEAKPSGTSKKMNRISEQTKDIREGWVPLKYHTVSSKPTAGYLQKMRAGDGSQIHFSMSSYDYLNNLCPGTSSDDFRSKRRSLLALPLKERFRTWLQEGPPFHRFGTLKHLAPDESPEEVLAVLQEHARLVQGLWVPKSSLAIGNAQGPLAALARDYVLLLFSKDLIIKSSQIPRKRSIKLVIEDVLKVLARERPALEDWKLKELPDLSFIKLYPSVVKKQEEEWECMEKNINDMLLGERDGPGVKNSSKTSTTNNPTTSKVPNKVATKTPTGSTRTGMSEEVREAIVKALQRLFKDTKVCSFQQISQRLRAMAVSESARSTGFAREAVAAANSIDAFPDELQAIISQVAVNIHGICVPISSPDNKRFDPFRRVVIDLFLAEGPNAKLKKATIFEAAKMKLAREVSQIEYQKVLQELCTSQGSAWVLRSADGNPTR